MERPLSGLDVSSELDFRDQVLRGSGFCEDEEIRSRMYHSSQQTGFGAMPSVEFPSHPSHILCGYFEGR